MLRVSPFLVAYAIFLLLTQYLFDLDFINEELVKIHINITNNEREQIGFSRSEFPVKELAIKVRYVLILLYLDFKTVSLVTRSYDNFVFWSW